MSDEKMIDYVIRKVNDPRLTTGSGSTAPSKIAAHLYLLKHSKGHIKRSGSGYSFGSHFFWFRPKSRLFKFNEEKEK